MLNTSMRLSCLFLILHDLYQFHPFHHLLKYMAHLLFVILNISTSILETSYYLFNYQFHSFIVLIFIKIIDCFYLIGLNIRLLDTHLIVYLLQINIQNLLSFYQHAIYQLSHFLNLYQYKDLINCNVKQLEIINYYVFQFTTMSHF